MHHLGSEIYYLLFTAAFIAVFGIPRILSNVWVPRDLEFQDVPDEQLTPEQAGFLHSYDEQVSGLGYRHFKTYRVSNMLGHNLIRVYLSSADPAKCVVVLAASKNKSLFASYVEFGSMYADGTHLVVNNNKTSRILDDVPGVMIRRYKGINDVAELKRRHDAEAETLRQRGIVFYTPENYFDDFRKHHRNYCEHQASRKLLRWDAKAGVYRATTRTALRGVVNFFNPLSGHFSPLRFAAGILLGGGLPILAATQQARISVWLAAHAGPMGLMAASYLPILIYGIAGISIGLLFSQRTFIWGILLGTFPNHVLFGLPPNMYSFWMALIADLTGRISNRRKNIL